MSEKPILFSGPMVEAILTGRKTQTRRTVSPANSTVGAWPWKDLDFSGHVRVDGNPHGPGGLGCGQYLHVPHREAEVPGAWMEGTSDRVRCRWLPGQTLWVRETFALVPRTAYAHDPSIPHRVSPDGHSWAVYRAGWERTAPSVWKPSIFMPRWASRLTLEIESVRVERLQSINLADAWDEMGRVDCPEHDFPGGMCVSVCGSQAEAQFAAFRELWQSINGKRPGCDWQSNPHVWVLSFHRLETPQCP